MLPSDVQLEANVVRTGADGTVNTVKFELRLTADEQPETFSVIFVIIIVVGPVFVILADGIENVVAPEVIVIFVEKPTLPIFTIHDSVATLQGYEDYVANVITEEVKKLTDLDVKLGYEYWNP